MDSRFIAILFTFFIVVSGSAQTPDSLNTIVDTTANVPIDTTANVSSDTTASSSDVLDQILDEAVSLDSLEAQKVRIEFVKKKTVHAPDSAYFNVCKITNTTTETISGDLLFTVPVGWSLIADPSVPITLAPGEMKVYPVRTTLAADAVGGMAYPIDAAITTEEGIYSGAAYVRIPVNNKWEMFVNTHTVYFNEYFDEQEFNIHINNKGNAEELIRLDFKVGKLLEVEGLTATKIYVSIPPKTDSVFTYKVRRALLNEDERAAYQQMWNESFIRIAAQSGLGEKYGESIQFRDLENVYINERAERASPLNVDLSVFNLLSSVRPRINASLFGEIQFRKEHDLSYIFQARNLFYTSNTLETFFQNGNNGTFNINYRWSDKIRAQLGEINNYSMHSMRGWGINASYNFDKDNKITGSYIFGKYFPMMGSNIRYDTRIKKVGVHIGATWEDNDLLHFDAISVQSGVNFPIARNHLINVTLMGTQSVYDQNAGIEPPNDTTVIGFSYAASYTGMAGKFRFGANTRNDQFNYLRIRPANRIGGYARYMINDRSRINLTGQFNSMQASRLLFTNFFSGAYNSQQLYRLSYTNRVTEKISFEGGPSSRILSRFQIDTSATVTSDFYNYFVGVYGLTRIRFDEFRMLTPTISAGATIFRDNIADLDTLPVLPTTNLGVSYIARNWGASANYIYGPNFFLTQGFVQNEIIGFETVHLRANYTRFINDGKIRFTAFGNYYLRLPSNRQNFAASGRFDIFFSKGWMLYVQGNAFTNSVDTESNGLVSRRNFNLNFGVRKSFDIAQPRVKYHDLKVVCFNDINGDGIRDDNEPLIPNIKMTVAKNLDLASPDQARFGEQDLVTDPDGSMEIVDIPEGHYSLVFSPLQNLGNLYNARGDQQDVVVSENMTIYVPYVESYKVSGKVILNRDEYSSLGLVNVNGIRVTAMGVNGETYAALTDSDGNYSIDIPQGGYYKIKVNNIFGDNFEIDRDEFIVQFNGFKSFNVDFTFFEYKRKVNFNGGNLFNFESINTEGEEGESDDSEEEENNE